MPARHKVGTAAVSVIALGVLIVFAFGAAKPDITMALVSQGVRRDSGECVIGLTNNGAAITYVGYSRESPLYTCVRDTPSGALTNFLFICGTGLGERTLASGEGVQFKAVHVGTNAPTRILLRYKQRRLIDRLRARLPQFIQSRIPQREWRTAEVRVTS